MRPIDRRDFLRTGGVALLGLAAAACGNGEQPRAGATGGGGKQTLDDVIAGRASTLGVLVGLTETLARRNERLPVILHRPGDPQRTFQGGTGRLWIAESRTSDVLGPYELRWHDEGLADSPPGRRGIYSARVSIPRDGSWLALVEATPIGVSGTLVGGSQFGVGPRSNQPKPGEQAISVATPTPRNHRGVEPYCTRKPPCSMHAASLDDALKSNKPVVLIIATPAFCSSRTCGPQVDVVQEVWRDMRDKVTFVHVEVYKDDEEAPAKTLLSPAAKAWRLEEEPVTYFIGADGTIADRFVGPAAVDEVRAAAIALT